MQRRINPWVALLTAALTFGILTALVGSRWANPRWHSQHRHGWHHNAHCYDGRGQRSTAPALAPDRP